MKKTKKVNRAFNCYIEPRRSDIDRYRADRGQQINDIMAKIKKR